MDGYGEIFQDNQRVGSLSYTMAPSPPLLQLLPAAWEKCGKIPSARPSGSQLGEALSQLDSLSISQS